MKNIDEALCEIRELLMKLLEKEEWYQVVRMNKILEILLKCRMDEIRKKDMEMQKTRSEKER